MEDFMKKMVDDMRLIFKCCSLYYQDRKGQQEICDLLGISRPTVSRMLKLGREYGIVKIEINNPDNVAFGQLERKIEKMFNLREVIIVQSSPLEKGTQHISSAIGKGTLDFLSRAIEDGDYVGVGMGMTIQNVTRAECVIEKMIKCTFVPILGGVGESRLDIHSNYLAREFADLFGGECIQFFSPAIFSDKKVWEGFQKEKSIQKILKMYHKIDMVIMGIGIPKTEDSTLLETGYVDRKILEDFVTKGAVGDIALRFFNIKGETQAFQEFNERIAGMPTEQLEKVPRRVGIAGGKQKAEAVLGAIRGGYINILITDVDCAQNLVALAENNE
jgi:Transcriptional regulator, contains sigma factor-related N-terminal domain